MNQLFTGLVVCLIALAPRIAFSKSSKMCELLHREEFELAKAELLKAQEYIREYKNTFWASTFSLWAQGIPYPGEVCIEVGVTDLQGRRESSYLDLALPLGPLDPSDPKTLLRFDLIELLLKFGVDPNVQVKSIYSYNGSVYFSSPPLSRASQACDRTLAKLLLSYGATLSAEVVHDAVRWNCPDVLMEFLTRDLHGNLARIKNSKGEEPVHALLKAELGGYSDGRKVEANNYSIVRVLKEAGADLNAPLSNHRTVLQAALEAPFPNSYLIQSLLLSDVSDEFYLNSYSLFRLLSYYLELKDFPRIRRTLDRIFEQKNNLREDVFFQQFANFFEKMMNFPMDHSIVKTLDYLWKKDDLFFRRTIQHSPKLVASLWKLHLDLERMPSNEMEILFRNEEISPFEKYLAFHSDLLNFISQTGIHPYSNQTLAITLLSPMETDLFEEFQERLKKTLQLKPLDYPLLNLLITNYLYVRCFPLHSTDWVQGSESQLDYALTFVRILEILRQFGNAAPSDKALLTFILKLAFEAQTQPDTPAKLQNLGNQFVRSEPLDINRITPQFPIDFELHPNVETLAKLLRLIKTTKETHENFSDF